MGIRNAVCGSRLEHADVRHTKHSLPLMGIRNLRTARLREHVRPNTDSTHYPSWGSETECGDLVQLPAGDANSLPLMGIRNCIHELLVKARLYRRRRLTTPHGDQKRATNLPGPPPSDHFASLPPHGDQKPSRARSGSRPHTNTTRAHYPSWGSETSFVRPSRGSRRSSPACSLPLMGIRNRDHRLDARSPRFDLTTPHGDQKRCDQVPRASSIARAPHYPSWGSETRRPSRCLKLRWSIETHYPSWGSETDLPDSS